MKNLISKVNIFFKHVPKNILIVLTIFLHRTIFIATKGPFIYRNNKKKVIKNNKNNTLTNIKQIV